MATQTSCSDRVAGAAVLDASLRRASANRRPNSVSSVAEFRQSPSLTLFKYLCGSQVLECRVCDNVYGVQGDKIPRLLFCGHSLCHACLLRLPKTDSLVQCPFDRQPTPLGKVFSSPYVCFIWFQTPTFPT